MLPRLDTLQRVIFTRRLIVFNETFAELGPKGKVYACLWHNGISGRKSDDMLSAFHHFYVECGHYTSHTTILDNCSSQNKHWNLFAHLTLLINSNLITTETIVLKYLVKGHTFMAADSFHGSVERKMVEVQNLYNFEDFIECVQKSRNDTPTIYNLGYIDFFKPTIPVNKTVISKQNPKPLLGNFSHVKFSRGLFELEVSSEIDGSNAKKIQIFSIKQVEHFQKPSLKFEDTLIWRHEPLGISQDRKEEIIKNCLALMPAKKQQFWLDLPTNDNEAE